jgi:hypothetical protein
MFKVVLFKFMLIILYLFAGLVAKYKGNSKNNINDPMIEIYNSNDDQVVREVGVPTNWLNPYMTRFATSTTTIRTTELTTIFLRTKSTTQSRFLQALTDDDKR